MDIKNESKAFIAKVNDGCIKIPKSILNVFELKEGHDIAVMVVRLDQKAITPKTHGKPIAKLAVKNGKLRNDL